MTTCASGILGGVGMKLRDKVAIITGAGRGIGRATALALGREGAAISLAARTAAEIETVAREVQELGAQALPVVTDITREEDVARLVQRTLDAFGRIDVLVNNAGIGIPMRDVVDLGLDTQQASHWHAQGVRWIVGSTNRLFVASVRKNLEDIRKVLG